MVNAANGSSTSHPRFHLPPFRTPAAQPPPLLLHEPAVGFENKNKTAVADRARAKHPARQQVDTERLSRDKAANKADRDAKATKKEERKQKVVKGERRR